MEKKIGWILIIFCGVLAFPYLALAFFNHPSADDYLVAVPAMQWGPITATLGWYYSWSCRFSANLILTVNPMVFKSLVGYQLMAWGLISFLVFGFWQFLKSVFPSQSFINRFGLAILSTLVYFSATPSPVEALYYFSGAVCYQPANALFLILGGMLVGRQPLQRISQFNPKELFFLALKGGIIITIAGFNEVAMAFQLAIFGAMILVCFLETGKVNLEYGLLFIFGLIGAALIIFSPATFYRMEASQSFHREIGEVIKLSIGGFFKSVFQWIKVSSFLLLMVYWILIREPNGMPLLKKSTRYLVSLLSFLLLIFCFIPSFLGEGTIQGRTANFLQFLFLFFVILNGLIWRKATSVEGESPSRILLYLPLIIAFLAIASPNSLQAWDDLASGTGRKFHEERMERIHLLESAQGDSVWVPPVTHRPKTIFFGEIGVFPQPWYDNFVAQYHGKKFIHLQDSSNVK
jgi:hypothetical protein